MDLGGIFGGLAGGLLNFFGQKETNDQNAKIAAQNIALQQQFAQNGIQWKVNDAKQAGVNPLFALGASTSSFSPISVGNSSPLGAASQDISRAIAATSTKDDKDYQTLVQAKTLRKMDLENDLLASQIAKSNQTQNISMPTANQRWGIDGQGQTAQSSGRGTSTPPGTLVNFKPLDITGRDPQGPHGEAGAIPDLGYSKTQSGWSPQFSKDLADRMDENHIGSLTWGLRNQILPSFGGNYSPPPSIKLPPGYKWWYDPAKQEYQMRPPSKTWFGRQVYGH